MKLGSLRLKALLLFTAMTLVPVAIAIALLLEVNRAAVRTSEAQLQAAVLSEIAGRSLRIVQAAQSDARAVATAIGEAAYGSGSEDDALAGAEALFATLTSFRAARFEVPSANVSTVIRAKDAADSDAPTSTAALRSEADERGVGFTTSEPGWGTLVLPILRRGRGDGPRGYVTVAVDFRALAESLAKLAVDRFEEGSVSLLVADSSRKAIASFGVAGATSGSDVSALPIWAAMPDGTSWTTRIGVVAQHEDKGVPMVGVIESVPELGWAVALWRPEPVAYAALDRMRRIGAMVAIGAVALALLAGLFAARTVTAPVLRIAAQARLIGERKWREVKVVSTSTDELGQLERSVARMAEDLEKGEIEIERQAKLRNDLGRFMSRELVDAIVRGEHSLSLGGKRAQVSVVFADVVAFTPLAESRPAEEVVALLNELFSVLTEVVFRHGGTVDKFVGDCIMAVWGAPIHQEDHAERALAAAEDMMRFLETAAVEWREKYDVEVRLGIGVNSGEAIVGNIGSDKRMEYTVIGDVVNVAARLEAIARPNQVLVAEATYELAHERYAMTLLGERKLTGRQKETKVYELETA